MCIARRLGSETNARSTSSWRATLKGSAALQVGAALLVFGSMAACESTPIRALRGASHYTSGTASLERGDSARAIDELVEAARLVPQSSEIQNHLGLAYWAEGRTDEAGAAFDRAIALDCDNRAARRNRELLDRHVFAPHFAASEEGSSDGGG